MSLLRLSFRAFETVCWANEGTEPKGNMLTRIIWKMFIKMEIGIVITDVMFIVNFKCMSQQVDHPTPPSLQEALQMQMHHATRLFHSVNIMSYCNMVNGNGS